MIKKEDVFLPEPLIVERPKSSNDDFFICFQDRLKNLFKRLIIFLNAHDIPWWASDGTAIGAIRHRDMIPWDDDVDIMMKRSDIEFLYSLQSELNKEGLEIRYFKDYGYIHSYVK